MLAYLAILPNNLIKLTSPLRKYTDLLSARFMDALILLESYVNDLLTLGSLSQVTLSKKAAKKAKKAGVDEVKERVKLLWGDRPPLPSNTDMKKLKDQLAKCKEMHKQILAYQEDIKNIAESDTGAMRVAEREIDRYQFGLELYHQSSLPDLEVNDAIKAF